MKTGKRARLALCIVAGVATILAAPRGAAAADVLFEIGNIYAVANDPPNATTIRLDRTARVTAISTYHWNDAKGAAPGTIALMNAQGDLFGPWDAAGKPGQGGVPNAYWTVTPNIMLQAGEYDVIDSEVETWAHNKESGGVGFVRVEGRAAGE